MTSLIPQWLIEVVFPRFCVGCSRIGVWWCHNCHNQTEFLHTPLDFLSDDSFLDEVWAAVNHKPPASSLVTKLKYNSVKELSTTIAKIMYMSLPLPSVDVVTAVPLHPKRQRERGFNQAAEIVRQVAGFWKIPYIPLLLRTEHTSAQAKIKSRQDRRSRLRSAFEPSPWLMQKANKHENTIKSVMIIDDVVTTGSTLESCAAVLKQAGIKQVLGAGFCHKQA